MGVRTTTIWKDGVDPASVPRISSHDGYCRIVLAKEGCGEVSELVAALDAQGIYGLFSVEQLGTRLFGYFGCFWYEMRWYVRQKGVGIVTCSYDIPIRGNEPNSMSPIREYIRPLSSVFRCTLCSASLARHDITPTLLKWYDGCCPRIIMHAITAGHTARDGRSLS
jgi:hypothetical protein